MNRFSVKIGVVAAFVMVGTAALLFSGVVGAQDAPDHNFVGVDACSRCHRMDRTGNQQAAWQNGPHSGAYETLATPEAATAAAAAGVENPQEAGECLRCHTTAYGVPDANLGEGFDRTKGVQCESCHGPGADYSPMPVMRDHDQAVANGLVIPTEAVCTQCHNSDSPTFESFDFAGHAAQIAHPNPTSE